MGFTLEDVARNNLAKTMSRWNTKDSEALLPGFVTPPYDEDYPEEEQLPRSFAAHVDQVGGGPNYKVHVEVNGISYGQLLTDNSFADDGYRFHDVFHLAYMALLGWSPVSRRNLKLKRKSNTRIDEVEDGGRAIVIEEGVSALVFQYAEGRSFLEGATTIDYEILSTIKKMTAHLEVRSCSLAMWERAILEGYKVWRLVRRESGGIILYDGVKLEYKPKDNTAND
jgi:hypothetical protein